MKNDKNIRHLKCNKNMSYNQKFITKWKEQYRKNINFYEPVISLKNLFKEPIKPIKKLVF